MWKKWLAALSLAVVILILAGSSVLADTVDSGAKTIVMRGQAAFTGSDQASQLRLKTQSIDNSGWLLELSLSPVSSRPDDTNGGGWNVTGTYTLGLSQQPLSTGTVGGWFDSDGSGYLRLSGSASTSLQMPFQIGSDGSAAAALQGNWPLMPAPPAVPGTSAVSAPAQPSGHFFWYLSRTAAIAAYIMLFVALCLGIGIKTRYLDKIVERWRAFDLHRFTALLGIGLVLLHVFSLFGDAYFNYSLPQLLIPGASPYRPFWVSLGTIGLYALVIVAFSMYFRKFIGQKAWRLIHYASFVLIVLIFIHAVKSGTDSAAPWTQWLYVSTGTFLVFLFLTRLFILRPSPAAA